jgi:hypothetical protein
MPGNGSLPNLGMGGASIADFWLIAGKKRNQVLRNPYWNVAAGR